jgi:hypothetical protein
MLLLSAVSSDTLVSASYVPRRVNGVQKKLIGFLDGSDRPLLYTILSICRILVYRCHCAARRLLFWPIEAKQIKIEVG